MSKLITVEELADQLRMKPGTIYNIRSGPDGAKRLPPAVRVGRSLLWRQEDVDAFIASKVEGVTNVIQMPSRKTA